MSEPKIIINTTEEQISNQANLPVIEPVIVPVVENVEPIVEVVNEPVVESIEIDGVIYNLDANGNAIDSNKAVKYSKEQIDAFEDLNESLPGVKDIAKLNNIIPVDESGKEIEYENSPQGIAKYASDVYEIGANQGIENFKNELFGKYPILVDVINHLNINNNSLENFSKKTTYSSIELDAKNESQLKSVIIAGRLDRGDSADKAEKYYNFVKASNSEYDEASEELKYLIDNEKKIQNEVALTEQNRIKTEAETAQKFWGVGVNEKNELVNLNIPNSVYSTIVNGKLKINEDTYNIPDKIRINDNGKVVYKSRDDFFNYLYVPTERLIDNRKVSMTGHEYDVMIENQKRGVSDDVFEAYKRFVKYDISQFIKDNISNAEVKSIVRKSSNPSNKQGNVRSTITPGRIIIPKHG